MLTRNEAFDLIEQTLELCVAADGAEVALGGGELALTRFANSEIHQNVVEDRVTVTVRTVIGKRTARASTTRRDAEGLRAVVDEAIESTRRAPKDKDLLGLFSDSENAEETCEGVDFESSAGLPPPEARAEQFAAARDVLTGSGLELFGYASAWRGNIGAWGESPAFAVGNSRGIRRFAAPAHHTLSLTVGRGDRTAWAHAESPAATPLDAAAMARTALAKAQRLADPIELRPSKMTAVLEPAAAADLLGFLAPHATGRAVEERQSCLTGKMGEPVFGENVTIRDDVLHPLQRGVTFDAEGVPRQMVTLVERGIAKEVVHDRATAARAGVEPTGHGLPVPSAEGAHPMNLVMEGGDASVDDLIASTERGVLVTRSWYSNFVDFHRAMITGMTRDGTFLIEGGKVTRPVRDLRFNISLFELFTQIEALGPQGRHEGVVAPAMKVRDFRFTS